MSTYYDFMVEAKYEGKWYNIDFHTKDIDGKLRHQYLATISRSFIGLLEDQVNGAWAISFDDLAESTQQLLLASTFEGREDSLRLERFYVAGNLDDFERLLNGPYQMEYYVTRNQIAAYEEQKIDEILRIPDRSRVARIASGCPKRVCALSLERYLCKHREHPGYGGAPEVSG